MAVKKRSLGRGLDALLSSSSRASTADTAREDAQFRELGVEQLKRGRYQPRLDIRQETLEDLADSIRAQGVVQPIVIRPVTDTGDGARFEIIAGERRWRAAQLAGLQKVPVIIRDVPDEAAVAMALIENIQRENLNPLEEARSLERLTGEFALTHQQAAEAVGRSRAAVSNLLRLLELGDEVKRLVERRELEMGHARALLGLTEPKAQAAAAREVVARGLSVRETERLVKRLAGGTSPRTQAPQRRNPDIQRLEAEVGEKLGARVTVQHTAAGRGKLVVSYNSLDELEGILGHIR
ncbi:ParB/RepB/Spo0J family partition protein [Wenzhouxiangella sp. XN24]|uniref:ParB/RepB/Spo0J family partition protein n=1 Tax=Wenzhouxiangella sp. XN24 TaxID=2713569 RepID=UPI0013ECED55|nr:ParB/RepB/Spo0J family partition protein [Wenzhouxiangella sp. XN24]NGX17546.1 ParB/RepB/Spo0J family partition protein [Wenzhouxiangella sp. XN24]